jgi:hypothetical protein
VPNCRWQACTTPALFPERYKRYFCTACRMPSTAWILPVSSHRRFSGNPVPSTKTPVPLARFVEKGLHTRRSYKNANDTHPALLHVARAARVLAACIHDLMQNTGWTPLLLPLLLKGSTCRLLASQLHESDCQLFTCVRLKLL